MDKGAWWATVHPKLKLIKTHQTVTLYNPTPLHSMGTTVLLFVSMNLTIKNFLTIQVPYISEIIQYLSFCQPIFLIYLTFITFKMTDILQGPQ